MKNNINYNTIYFPDGHPVPPLLTEDELIRFLRIPEISSSKNHHNVIENLKRFRDLRRTAITNWFYEGLEITEVMRLAGHSKYETTLNYYLAVKDDLVDKARKAIKHKVSKEMMDRCLGGEGIKD